MKYDLLWRKKGMKRWLSSSGQPLGGYKTKAQAKRNIILKKIYEHKIRKRKH